MTRVLAFDIGIKNLAWCCLEKNGETLKIIGWDNYNLLSEGSNVTSATGTKCAHCTAKATYSHSDKATCVRHCPPTAPAFRDLSGNLLRKLPSVADLKTLFQGVRPGQKVPTKKPQLLEELGKVFSTPLIKQKVSKAPDVGLAELHDSIRRLVTQQKTLWSTCTLILLENQPVFKNPTMKSVQILLFATLRDLLNQPPPALKLVHAGKKVQGAVTGDAGYRDRKAGSEARAEAALKSEVLLDTGPWQQVWTKAAKKSDLADALCMCIDVTL
jgi:hypothetical protein